MSPDNNNPNIDKLAEDVVKAYHDRYFCGEAIVKVFSGHLDLGLAPGLAAGFSGGFAASKDICGAISGAAIIIGSLWGSGSEKEDIVKVVMNTQKIMQSFKKRFESLDCSDLVGDRNIMDMKTKIHCSDFVAHTARDLAEMVLEKVALRPLTSNPIS